MPVVEVARAGEAPDAFAEGLPVLPHPLPVHPAPGQPTGDTAQAVLSSIREAVRLTRAGETAAVVTNPIAKHVLTAAGFDHPAIGRSYGQSPDVDGVTFVRGYDGPGGEIVVARIEESRDYDLTGTLSP